MLASRITEQIVPIRAEASNQSIGNQVVEFFALQSFLHTWERMTSVLVPERDTPTKS